MFTLQVPGKYLEERINTDRDCRSLRECFRNLGFQLRIYNDKTCLEIKKILLEGMPNFLFLMCISIFIALQAISDTFFVYTLFMLLYL